MDPSQLPTDFFANSHAFTPHIYRDQYDAIDPSSTALSQAGKVIIITGAGYGIGGRGIAPAFAKAGAKGIVLVGRKAEKLAETENAIKKLNPSVSLLSVTTDISSLTSVEALFSKVKSTFGTADVLVNNAGVVNNPMLISASDPESWWLNHEIMVKGTYLMTRAFLSLLGGGGGGDDVEAKIATIINVNSWAGISVLPGWSSYSMAKLGVIHLNSYIAAENPNVTAVTLHPGLVVTDSTNPSFRRFALDTPELAGGVCVWLSTDKAAFLSGRYVDANWSVEDLEMRKDEIVRDNLLRVELQGKFGLEEVRRG